MIDIVAILSAVPDFLLYVAPGYILISVYNFCVFKQQETQHKFAASVIASFVLVSCFNTFAKPLEEPIYYVAIIAFAVIAGILIGVIAKSRLLSNVLMILKIDHTFNQRIWEDAIKSGDWVALYMRDTDEVFYGLFEHIQDYCDKPLIALSHCQILNKRHEIVVPYDDKYPSTIIIDTNDCIRVSVMPPVASHEDDAGASDNE